MKITASLIFLLLLFVIGCEDPATSQTGTISVTVVDGTQPVPNKTITLLPDSLVKKTDMNGECIFRVNAGKYYVNANLSGPGPAKRVYNKPVTIKGNETIKIKLETCLTCM